MAKFTKDDYTALASSVAAQIGTLKGKGGNLSDADIMHMGQLLTLHKRVLEIRDTPPKPRGKSATPAAKPVAAAKK